MITNDNIHHIKVVIYLLSKVFCNRFTVVSSHHVTSTPVVSYSLSLNHVTVRACPDLLVIPISYTLQKRSLSYDTQSSGISEISEHIRALLSRNY
jgi:hypothetical protein